MTRRDRFTAIGKVLDRYEAKSGLPFKRIDAFMDLDYSKVNVVALLDADDATFFHDVNGVFRHFNRETMELDDCFMPRVGVER